MVTLRLPASGMATAWVVVLPNLVSTLYAAVAGPDVTASNFSSTASMAGSPVIVPVGNGSSLK